MASLRPSFAALLEEQLGEQLREQLRNGNDIKSWLLENIELLDPQHIPRQAEGWLSKVYGDVFEDCGELKQLLLTRVTAWLTLQYRSLQAYARTLEPREELSAAVRLFMRIMDVEQEQQKVRAVYVPSECLRTDWETFVEQTGAKLFQWYYAWQLGARGVAGHSSFGEQKVYMPYHPLDSWKDEYRDIWFELIRLVCCKKAMAMQGVPGLSSTLVSREVVEKLPRCFLLPIHPQDEDGEGLGKFRTALAYCIAMQLEALDGKVCLDDFHDRHRYDTILSAVGIVGAPPSEDRWGDGNFEPYYLSLKAGVGEKLGNLGEVDADIKLKFPGLKGWFMLRDLQRQAADLRDIVSSRRYEDLDDYQWNVLVFFAATERQRLHERAVTLRGRALEVDEDWTSWIERWRTSVQSVLDAYDDRVVEIRQWPGGRKCPSDLFPKVRGHHLLYRPWTFGDDYPQKAEKVSFGRRFSDEVFLSDVTSIKADIEPTILSISTPRHDGESSDRGRESFRKGARRSFAQQSDFLHNVKGSSRTLGVRLCLSDPRV